MIKNNKEYLDILDINGNKIGVKERGQAKKDKDIIKIVYLWIINEKNEILLQKRALNKKSNPGKWDCAVAGHILAGETSIDAIKREAKEELNLDIDVNSLKLIYSGKGNDGKIQFHDVFLLMSNVDIKEIKIQEEEVESVKYFDFKKLLEIYNSGDFANDFHNDEVIEQLTNLLCLKVVS